MALEQKQRKEQGKSQSTTYPSMGGFVGINKLTDPSRTPVTTTRRRREQENEEPSAPVQGDNQMFILGLLKEQTQEIKDKEKVEVNESSLLCASDESQIAKFCH
eukprot:TRINITY_DN6940_c0_g1_i3.p2 TRINITY_DN6940_c0_g1~~TRINITY_DN6940_c0_g1_i3.p2  ORF type:complete len:104 (-),score=27.15 TRINITY_DN6940_c0_g1_i3:732-1043(-)